MRILYPLAALCLIAGALSAQTAQYPSSLATDATLMIGANRITTSLTVAQQPTDTVAVVASTAGITANMLISIDSEVEVVCGVSGGNTLQIGYTGGGLSCPNSSGRGFDHSVAAAHSARNCNLTSSNQTGCVLVNFDAWHHNSLKEEVKAIESTLGPNLVNFPAFPAINAAQYAFAAQTPGGSLSVGTNVITLSPMPPGIGAYSAASGGVNKHYLYISRGTGTAEAVPITGWTPTSVIVTCAQTHSGAWTIESATGGVEEAINYAWQNARAVTYWGSAFNPGNTISTNVNLYGPVYVPPGWGNVIDFRGVNFTVLLTSALTSHDAWTFDTFDFCYYFIGNQIYWPSQPNGSAIFRFLPQLANGEGTTGLFTSWVKLGVVVPAQANGAPGTQGYAVRITCPVAANVISGLDLAWMQINGGQYGVYIDNPACTNGFNSNTLTGYMDGQSVTGLQIGTSNAGSSLLVSNTYHLSGYAGATSFVTTYGTSDEIHASIAGGNGDAFQLKAGSARNAVFAGNPQVGGLAWNNAGAGNRLFMGGSPQRVVVSVGASPYTLQNLTGRPMSVFVSGASITSIGISADGVTYDNATSPPINTYYMLPPDGYLKVTYSAGAPNIFEYF